MSSFILIKEFDTTYSHFPDVTGNYASLCGLDGNDLASDVQQSTISDEAETVTCPYCIDIFDVIKQYTEEDLSRPANNGVTPTGAAPGEEP